MLSRILLVLALAFGVAQPALADHPHEAEVVRVIDGDTFEARIIVGQDVFLTSRVRLPRIDAPEAWDRCASATSLRQRSTERLQQLAGERVLLSNIRKGWYNRVIADVHNMEGEDIGEILLQEGLARPYHGHRSPWCP